MPLKFLLKVGKKSILRSHPLRNLIVLDLEVVETNYDHLILDDNIPLQRTLRSPSFYQYVTIIRSTPYTRVEKNFKRIQKLIATSHEEWMRCEGHVVSEGKELLTAEFLR